MQHRGLQLLLVLHPRHPPRSLPLILALTLLLVHFVVASSMWNPHVSSMPLYNAY